MNIHPLFVHFPIGLLVVYSLLELGGSLLPALRRQPWAFPVKAFLLFAGVLAALTALFTGALAAEGLEGDEVLSPLIKVHASFAAATTALYIILAATYLNRVFDRKGWFDRIVGTDGFPARLWRFKRYLASLVLDTWLLPALALFALIGMTVTGALGAALVYGPDIDPFVSFIYHFFWTK